MESSVDAPSEDLKDLKQVVMDDAERKQVGKLKRKIAKLKEYMKKLDQQLRTALQIAECHVDKLDTWNAEGA